MLPWRGNDRSAPPTTTHCAGARAGGGERTAVGEALRHLDNYGSGPDAPLLAESLARFLVARCESHHAGWRVVRQVVVDSAADAPWERCARRAVPLVAGDLLSLAGRGGPDAAAPRPASRRPPPRRAGHRSCRPRAVLAESASSPTTVDDDTLARSDRRRRDGPFARTGRPRACRRRWTSAEQQTIQTPKHPGDLRDVPDREQRARDVGRGGRTGLVADVQALVRRGEHGLGRERVGRQP